MLHPEQRTKRNSKQPNRPSKQRKLNEETFEALVEKIQKNQLPGTKTIATTTDDNNVNLLFERFKAKVRETKTKISQEKNIKEVGPSLIYYASTSNGLWTCHVEVPGASLDDIKVLAIREKREIRISYTAKWLELHRKKAITRSCTVYAPNLGSTMTRSLKNGLLKLVVDNSQKITIIDIE